MAKKRHGVGHWLEQFAVFATRWSGRSEAFLLAVFVIIIWGATGPMFGYSDTWQLVINTSTTIVTFLMVFLIQRAQNKDALAIQLKLNELVAALKGASNHLIDAEDLSETELQVLHAHYGELARLARKSKSITESHSVEEAASRHRGKIGNR